MLSVEWGCGAEIRPFCVADLDALDPPLAVAERFGFPEWLATPVSSAVTLTEGGRVLGCGGVLAVPGSRVGRAWAIFGEDLRSRPLLLHRNVLRSLPEIVEGLGLERLEARVLAEFAASRRWLERLGFRDLGPAPDPLGRGMSYRRYVKIIARPDRSDT